MSHVCVFWHGSFASSSRRVSILSKLWSYIHRSNPQNLFFKEALLSSNSSLTYLHCSLVLLFINNFRYKPRSIIERNYNSMKMSGIEGHLDQLSWDPSMYFWRTQGQIDGAKLVQIFKYNTKIGRQIILEQ